ncbi:MAG: homoserine O-acetyltransferase [Cyclobacteriaceae bacterium]
MPTTLIQPDTKILKIDRPLVLECGEQLTHAQITYTTMGEPNSDLSNVVWVFHALTGNANPTEWWPGLTEENGALNAEHDFIICANVLGSCYGTTGPQDHNFPMITVRDIVKGHQLLRDELGIKKVKLGIGGSLGGQQLLEWAVQEPDIFENIAAIATNAQHSPWGIAFNEAQRMALSNIDKGKGLEAARAIAMLSYRHYETFEKTQKDEDQRWDDFSASSYQQYQGEKLRKRFTSETYYYLSKAMDSHNVGRHFVSIKDALNRVNSNTLVVGIDTDILFPLKEQELIAKHIPKADFKVIESHYGHDGFLVESAKLNKLIKDFLGDS